MPVLDLIPTLTERLTALHAERARVADRLAQLRGADGWDEAPAVPRLSRLEREAVALANGQPVPDAEPDEAILRRRLDVIDRAVALLDAQAARAEAPVLQARIDDNADALTTHVSAVVKTAGKLAAALPALRDAIDEGRALHIERSLLADRMQRGGDVGALAVRFRDDLEHAAAQALVILERLDELVKDAAAAGVK